MTQRIRNSTCAFNDHPFSSAGVSLYATIGTSVVYRNLRFVGRGRKAHRRKWIKGTGGRHDIAAATVQKTARVAFAADPTAQIVYSLPANFASQRVTFDVRRCKDDVENLSSNFRARTVELDGNRDDATEILGTVELVALEERSGGVVRIRFIYHAHRDGIQPLQFVVTRTAGPTSPADATVSYNGERLIEIDTPALSDSAAYTYTIRAENGATTADVLTGISVTADATGPDAPANTSAIPY